MFKDVTTPDAFGTLIIDEAGQAQPQMALGAFYRCRRALVVGDPKQIEPIVTSELDALKAAICQGTISDYKSKKLSVQYFADAINEYGAYYGKDTENPEWVGCPLVVHRRCISPMYDISNIVSYDGIMREAAIGPKPELEKMFALRYSLWRNIKGSEIGNKNHYVPKQGIDALKIIQRAFDNSRNKPDDDGNLIAPDIFVIAPFRKVVSEFKKYIKEECQDEELKEVMLNKDKKRIGTVHSFQGKEASEVIFMLGCDEGSINSTSFVNSNMVNVAASRAKYRLYVLGDIDVWKSNPSVNTMYGHLKQHEENLK